MGFGSSIGGFLGNLGSMLFPKPGINGKEFGSAIGGLLPFKKGGRIPAHKIMGFARGGDVSNVPPNAYQRGGKVRKSRKGKARKSKK